MDGRWGRDLQKTIGREEERQYVHERPAMATRNIQRVRGATDKPRLPIVELSEVSTHVLGHLVKSLHAYGHTDVGVADVRIVNGDNRGGDR